MRFLLLFFRFLYQKLVRNNCFLRLLVFLPRLLSCTLSLLLPPPPPPSSCSSLLSSFFLFALHPSCLVDLLQICSSLCFWPVSLLIKLPNIFFHFRLDCCDLQLGNFRLCFSYLCLFYFLSLSVRIFTSSSFSSSFDCPSRANCDFFGQVLIVALPAKNSSLTIVSFLVIFLWCIYT